MTLESYQIIEAARKKEWDQSFVWQGQECRVRTKDGKFLPEVLTYFYRESGDYQSLGYPFRSVETLGQAIELAQAAALNICRNGRTAKQVLADGTADRAWNNIEAQD